jgi:hypothetical protein
VLQNSFMAVADNIATDMLGEPGGDPPSRGPFIVDIKDMSGIGVVASFMLQALRRSDGSFPWGSNLLSDLDTAVTDEDTDFDGNGALTAFSGESLDNTPVQPFSVRIEGAGATVDLYDKFGNGKLYAFNADPALEVEAGSVNYDSGALVLDYSGPGAPAAGNLTADYQHSAQVGLVGQPNHRRIFKLNPVGAGRKMTVYCAGTDGSGQVRCEVITMAEQ